MADTKQQWYKDAKYGLFIHWGLYSILAGEWKDPKTGEVTKTDRIAEWIENNLNIDKEDYRKLKDEFHPDKFDADMFVKSDMLPSYRTMKYKSPIWGYFHVQKE